MLRLVDLKPLSNCCVYFVQMQEKLNNWSNSFANASQCRKFEEALDSIRRMTYYERVNEEIVKKL